jgi:hypothetical protein
MRISRVAQIYGAISVSDFAKSLLSFDSLALGHLMEENSPRPWIEDMTASFGFESRDLSDSC